MNSKLGEMLKQLYTTAVQDADGVMAGRKGYRMRYDEVPERMEKAIRQAVGEEMLELITPNQRGQFEADGGHIAWYLDDLQKVIKQWQGGEDE